MYCNFFLEQQKYFLQSINKLYDFLNILYYTTIGIIIDCIKPITKKYFLKNKVKFECLSELLESLDYIPFDYALYAEAKAFG